MPKEKPPQSAGFPARPGTYALLLELAANTSIQVGKLGRFVFPAGVYLYVGSALGPGGLSARLNRHISQEKRLHWHIDYLLQHAQIEQIWYAVHEHRQEHSWAVLLQKLKGATTPVPSFGASDCRCQTHLFHFQKRPEIEAFRQLTSQHFPVEPTILKMLL